MNNKLADELEFAFEQETKNYSNIVKKIIRGKVENSSNSDTISDFVKELAIKMAKWGRNNPKGFISEVNFEKVAEKHLNELLEKKTRREKKERDQINFFKKHYAKWRKTNDKKTSITRSVSQLKSAHHCTKEETYAIIDKAFKEMETEIMEFID